jgi:hypothetical protein
VGVVGYNTMEVLLGLAVAVMIIRLFQQFLWYKVGSYLRALVDQQCIRYVKPRARDPDVMVAREAGSE